MLGENWRNGSCRGSNERSLLVGSRSVFVSISFSQLTSFIVEKKKFSGVSRRTTIFFSLSVTKQKPNHITRCVIRNPRDTISGSKPPTVVPTPTPQNENHPGPLSSQVRLPERPAPKPKKVEGKSWLAANAISPPSGPATKVPEMRDDS